MTPIIVPAYAAILAFLYIFLSVRVIRMRGRARVAVGSGGNTALERRMRVHANFAEYVPFALILLTFLEMQAQSRYLIHSLALILIAARLIHAYGMSRERENFRIRATGMILTFSVLIVAGVTLLNNGLRAAFG
jgi:uncharacterized protein